MALGGGTFLVQNKILPGTYINFISAAKASANLSDRGYIAFPLELDWGPDGEVFAVSPEDFQKESLSIFGYDYTHPKLKGLRDMFRHSLKMVYFYRLINNGVKAQNTYCTAKYKGIRGNDLKTVIAVNVDDETMVDVSTYLGTVLVDKQTVLPNTDNLKDTDYVDWKSNVVLEATAGLSLENGSNGDALTGTQYQAALDAFESYSFNTLGCLSTDPLIISLFVQYTKRLRDQVGVKFQTVVYRTAADYEGVISLENEVTDDTNPAALVYWVTGASAGCPVNKSNTNKRYDGEYTVNVDYKQSELEAGILAGKFMFHQVGENIRVLTDINSFTTVTDEKSIDFASNQTIRVLDQIANDIAVLFNTKYLGNVPNDADGRISLWNDIVKHHQLLESIRAIENFIPDDVKVSKGDLKKSVVVVDPVTPVNAMEQLYMTVIVS
jgi:hypothetical protein